MLYHARQELGLYVPYDLRLLSSIEYFRERVANDPLILHHFLEKVLEMLSPDETYLGLFLR